MAASECEEKTELMGGYAILAVATKAVEAAPRTLSSAYEAPPKVASGSIGFDVLGDSD